MGSGCPCVAGVQVAHYARSVAAYLAVSERGEGRVVMLEGLRLAVGRVSDNDLVLASDPEVSRFHATFESIAGGWCLRDLSSKNGTFVNGDRLGGDRPLRSGDEIRIGRTSIIFHTGVAGDDASLTQAPERAPEITLCERDVLIALPSGGVRFSIPPCRQRAWVAPIRRQDPTSPRPARPNPVPACGHDGANAKHQAGTAPLQYSSSGHDLPGRGLERP